MKGRYSDLIPSLERRICCRRGVSRSGGRNNSRDSRLCSQLKSGALGARTIDEGAMDEKNGMNFSEYMAILSGNTDLLEKAKLEKRIASLESERKAHNKGLSDSKFRHQTITHDIANNEAAIERMKADVARYEAVVRRDKDGNPLNNLSIDTCNLSDEKNMGIHLQGLAQRTDTHGQYKRVG